VKIEELKEKRGQILIIAKRYGAQRLRVFGSLARGDSGRESDVDFLIELETGRSLLDLIAMKQDLEDLLQRKVDVVTEGAVSPYIRDEIVTQAISL
jgi:predicted nucleotidyltransferase